MFVNSYAGTRVLLTGDTGFKGAWLALWLHKLGAEVHGLALPPADDSTLFVRARLSESIRHTDGDIRDLATVEKTLKTVQPQIIFHMAAQALVRESYQDPLGTMMTNVIGTAHVCDALRRYASPCALVVVTSDKCYENHEWVYGYRENDAMGGGDPYSASKGAAELVTASWRRSFFPVEKLSEHRKAIATARAGNVIGAGDWAKDRIVPDAIRALSAHEAVMVRNPNSVRPWQHVLEPLSGYLWLGAKLLSAAAADFAEGWNFGPLPANTRTVGELVESLIKAWGNGSWQKAGEVNPPPEAHVLRLAIDKAFARLSWSPVWSFAETVERTAEGYCLINEHWDDAGAVRSVIENQIAGYEHAAKSLSMAWAHAK
jgi:CDP-glucose 4,6-dehydratase